MIEIHIPRFAKKSLGKDDLIRSAAITLEETNREQCFGFMHMNKKCCAYGLLTLTNPMYNHFNARVFIFAGKNSSIVDLNDKLKLTFKQIAACLRAVYMGYTKILYDPQTQLITGFIGPAGEVDSPIG